MEFLGIRDVRELTRLTPQNPQWKNLKAVLKNVRITTVVPAHSARRSRVIKDLVPHAGEYEFDKDGVGMIKGKVCTEDETRCRCTESCT